MISKNRIKLIRSLHRKKERIQHRKFIIEGAKPVTELLTSGMSYDDVYCTEDFRLKHQEINALLITGKEMNSISAMKTPPGILAVCDFLPWKKPGFAQGKFILLDRINDPGNLGTIIRIADWFAMDGVICSENMVDLYNPKVIQASMGSIFRIPVFYENLPELLSEWEGKTTVMAADMDGISMQDYHFPDNGFLLMGSESHGIDDDLKKYINHQITIPKYGRAESLNVAVATGILANRFKQG